MALLLYALTLDLGAGIYVLMTGLIVVWSLFSAPTFCGAINRKRGKSLEYCRENTHGLLLGCYRRQHKYQRLKRAWWSRSWREKTRDLWSSPSAKLATVTSVIGLITEDDVDDRDRFLAS